MYQKWPLMLNQLRSWKISHKRAYIVHGEMVRDGGVLCPQALAPPRRASLPPGELLQHAAGLH